MINTSEDATSHMELQTTLLGVQALLTTVSYVQPGLQHVYKPAVPSELMPMIDLILTIIQFTLLPMSIVLSLVNMIVFGQRSMRSATSIYLLASSFFQLLYLLLVTIGHIVQAIDNQYGYARMFCLFYLVSWGGSIVRRVGFIVASFLSAERLYAVARPLHVRDSWLARYPVPFIIATFIVTTLYHVYLVIKYYIGVMRIPGQPVMYSLLRTHLYDENSEGIDAVGASSKIIFAYIPLGLLVLFNVLTIWSLKRHTSKRRLLQGNGGDADAAGAAERRERQMTVTVVTATVLYILLALPETVHAIIGSFIIEYTLRGLQANVYNVMQDVGYACTLLSFSTDFFSFVSLSTAYRLALLGLLRRVSCWRTVISKDDDNKGTSMTSNIVTSMSEM